MRAKEFMDEGKVRRRKFLPHDPKTIDLHKQQYELLSKRADAMIKMKKANEEDDKTVETMADQATTKRMKTGKLK